MLVFRMFDYIPERNLIFSDICTNLYMYIIFLAIFRTTPQLQILPSYPSSHFHYSDIFQLSLIVFVASKIFFVQNTIVSHQ
jgi:hypothetical protein